MDQGILWRVTRWFTQESICQPGEFCSAYGNRSRKLGRGLRMFQNCQQEKSLQDSRWKKHRINDLTCLGGLRLMKLMILMTQVMSYPWPLCEPPEGPTSFSHCKHYKVISSPTATLAETRLSLEAGRGPCWSVMKLSSSWSNGRSPELRLSGR